MLVFSRLVGRGRAPAPTLNPPVVNDDTFSMPTSGAGWTAGMVAGTMTASNSPTSWSITAGDASNYYDIDNSGQITVTSSGITALDGDTGTSNLTVQATNADGSDTGAVTINYAPAAAASVIPLSYDDARYSSNTAGPYWGIGNPILSTLTLANGDWDGAPDYIDGDECIRNYAEGSSVVTFNQCRTRWREGPRIATSAGVETIFNECFLEVIGRWPSGQSEPDHGDGIQNFGTAGTTTLNNTTLRSYSDPAAQAKLADGVGTDAFRWADSSSGTVNFTNVLVFGGGRGITIGAQVGTTNIAFENVYIVDESAGSFAGSGFYRMLILASGGTINVTKWINVCLATIVNGEIVPGTQLANPGSGTDVSYQVLG